MQLLRKAKILITIPMKLQDPTFHTATWGQKAAQMARDMGYDVRTVEKDDTTYENVSKTIKEFTPDLFCHFGHGCVASLQGQFGCEVTRKYDVNEIFDIIDSGNIEKIEMVKKMLNPIGQISCPGICKLDEDVCSPLCNHPTNIQLLKNSIVYAVACYSAKQLGVCAEKYGIRSYVGFQDLYMFPVDNLNSQDMFGNVQLEFYKSLLLGKTVEESEQDMIKLEDSYIKKYKTVKYVALPMLWNKINRRLLGNKLSTIY